MRLHAALLALMFSLPAAASPDPVAPPAGGPLSPAFSEPTPLFRAPLASFIRIQSPFGRRYLSSEGRWDDHSGVDFAAFSGTEVYAAGDGTVSMAGRIEDYGLAAVIEHPSGAQTRYAHLSAVLVKPGQQVEGGRLIGRVGSTGRSTGPHLHYEVRKGGRPVDPLALDSL